MSDDRRFDKLRDQRYVEERKISEINSAIRNEVDEFEKTVKLRYADRLRTIRNLIADIDKELDEIRLAKRAVQAEENRKNPLCGKRVEELKAQSFSRTQASRPTGVIGVVEVFSEGDQFPANITTGVPQGGDLVIRVLKKDGSRSLKAIKLAYRDRGYELPHYWRLIEDGKTSGQ
jgi:hypothetical protein